MRIRCISSAEQPSLVNDTKSWKVSSSRPISWRSTNCGKCECVSNHHLYLVVRAEEEQLPGLPHIFTTRRDELRWEVIHSIKSAYAEERTSSIDIPNDVPTLDHHIVSIRPLHRTELYSSDNSSRVCPNSVDSLQEGRHGRRRDREVSSPERQTYMHPEVIERALPSVSETISETPLSHDLI